MFRSIWNIYIFGNVHISLCAVLWAAAAFKIIGASIEANYIAFVFFSTLFGYNLHRYYSQHFVIYGSAKRVDIIRDYPALSKLVLSFLLILTALFYFLLDQSYYVPSALLGVITISYLLPIKSIRLRDIAYLKIFLVGICWMGVFLVPVLLANLLSKLDLTLLAIEKTVFIIALTIPFDLRDRELDKKLGVPTVARLGIKSSQRLIATLLIVCIVLCFLLNDKGIYSNHQLTALITCYLMQLYLSYHSFQKTEVYFLLILDGIIGIQGLLMIIL